jgi:predicted RNase H-like HicB family nuclease
MRTQTTYAVVIEQAEQNFSAYVPDLPGVITVGVTLEGVRANIADAINLYLDECRRAGEEPPAPNARVE